VREKPASRSRFGRNLRRAIVLVLVLLCIASLLYFITLPIYARHRVAAMLRDLGAPDHAFTLETVSLTGLRITDLRAGSVDAPWLEAQSINVGYSPASLWRGRIRSIDARRATWRIAVRDDVVDWGFVLKDGTREAGLTLPFDHASLTDGELIIDLEDERLAIPLSGTLNKSLTQTTPGDYAAAMSAGPSVARGISLPQLQAVIALDKGGVTVAAIWPMLANATMAIDARIDLTSAGVSGVLDARVPQFQLRDREELARLIPAFNGIEMTGTYALDAHVTLADSRLEPLITLRANDAAIAHPDWPLAIVSAHGTLVFDSIAPLRTKGPQRIDVAQATTGELDITQGSVLFDLESLESLRIDSAVWTFADGGRFTTGGFSVNPRQPRIVATVAAENVDLNFWLKLLTNERADGEGRLRGEFAVNWDPSAYPRIQFTNGLLVADPPTGFVRTHDAQRLGAMLDESNPELAIDETLRLVKQRIIDALEDFGYTTLRLEFIPDGRDTTLRAELQGKGRRGANAQEFSGLVVNFHHFADALQNVLNARSAISGMREQAGERLKE
jgi:hypothetical protein